MLVHQRLLPVPAVVSVGPDRASEPGEDRQEHEGRRVVHCFAMEFRSPTVALVRQQR